jgi:signal transduction histidine kinase
LSVYNKSQGAGLGLYIAKIIVENSLSGELHVKSNFKGASFMIVLYKNSDGYGKKI